MTLEKLFLTVLEISVASSPIILLLLLVSPLLGRRYGPGLRCLLWLALAVRLIVPFNMPWRHAVRINLFPAGESQAAQTDWFLPNPARILENESVAEADTRDALSRQEDNRPKAVKIAVSTLLAGGWAAGAALFLLYHLGAYFHTLHRLRRWSAPVRDGETLDRLESVREELSIRGQVRLYGSSKAASPLLMGFIRPRIVLPEGPIAPERLDFMLRHELWHLKRGDLWQKLLMLAANAVHWFNPLVWLMDRQAGLDTELACDADVLRGAKDGERKAYGYAVLSFMEHGWRCKTPLTSRFYGGKKQVKKRFYNIADTSAKKRGTALLCAAVLIIAMAGCAVYAAEPAEQAAQPAAEAKNIAQISVPLPDVDRDILIRARVDDEVVAEDTLNPAEMDNKYWYLTFETESTGQVLVRVYIDKKLYQEILVHMEANEQFTSELYTNAGDAEPPQPASAPAPTPEDQNELEEIFRSIEWSNNPYSGGEMAWPLPDHTRIIQPFGETPQIPDNYHTGLDIAGENGAPIIATNDGTVRLISEEWTPNVGYGMYVILDHGGGISTLYGHCSKIMVAEGERVVKGQKIAEAGETGFASQPHLHFEVRVEGVTVDPMPYITSNGFVWPTNGGFISLGYQAYPGHTGVDILGVPEDAPVYAAAAGTVIVARNTSTGYGRYIIVDHGNGWQTLYAHNSALYVSVGDTVAQGQTIAAVGMSGSATGRNLHFEVRREGRLYNPEDFLTAPSESNPQDYSDTVRMRPRDDEQADPMDQIVLLEDPENAATHTPGP